MANSSLYNKLFGKKSQQGGAKRLDENNFFKLLIEKKEFLMYVFSNLITQLGITYYVMMNYNDKIPSTIFLFILQITLLFMISLIPMPSWMKFILFSIFSGLFGILLASIRKNSSADLIELALLGTLGIFGCMFFVGAILLSFGIQLGFRFSLGLLIALLFLLITKIVMSFSGTLSIHHQFFSIIGLLLFSLYIMYDTNNILQRNYSGDFITASMDYYLDILNIFINLINLDN